MHPVKLGFWAEKLRTTSTSVLDWLRPLISAIVKTAGSALVLVQSAEACREHVFSAFRTTVYTQLRAGEMFSCVGLALSFLISRAAELRIFYVRRIKHA